MPGSDAGRRDDEAVGRFVERMAMAFADVGFPRMAARVLFTVMSAEEPLTAAEIGERLAVSPAAVSGAVRYLTQFGILTREPVPGSRRDRYGMPEDAWYEATVIKMALFGRFTALADEGAAALGGPDSVSGRRMTEMRDFFAFVQQEMSLIGERWHAHREHTVAQPGAAD
ncbi:GbsR/MarR family transcriptional regulator [Micromonospora echinofusca]|nr:MarR family transcriptional regulator [Micromonospora echinofusca]